MWTIYDRMPPVRRRRLREQPLRRKRPRTHPRAALRPGTAAVVNISAGLDFEAVSNLGSVVMPGSVSFMQQNTA